MTTEQRWLVTGAQGMVGHRLCEQLHANGVSVLAADRTVLDITSADSIQATFRDFQPTVCINAAAWTAVDAAEDDELAADAVNHEAVAQLASAAEQVGTQFVTISTDYVFNGAADIAYGEDDPVDPVSAYGRTKAAGEQAALSIHPQGTRIVRTAWVYDERGANFVKTVLRLTRADKPMRVVADQIGQPTWAVQLANAIIDLVDSNADAGIYHWTSSGQTSWYEFAQAIVEADSDAARAKELISPIPTSEYPTPARRPAWSVLGHEKLSAAGLDAPASWRDMLQAAQISQWQA